MTLLVCGGRKFQNRALVFETLDFLHTVRGPVVRLIEGGASGADALAGEWADRHFVTRNTFRAQWMLYGAKAGPLRNQRMVQFLLRFAEERMVVAFPGGYGTKNCVELAQQAHIEVMEVAA